eukprot:UN05222
MVFGCNDATIDKFEEQGYDSMSKWANISDRQLLELGLTKDSLYRWRMLIPRREPSASYRLHPQTKVGKNVIKTTTKDSKVNIVNNVAGKYV